VLHTREDMAADPTIRETIDVVYGHLPPEQWPTMPRLRWVQVTSAGVEGLVARPEVRDHPAMLTNARIHGEPIAEHIFGMLLMLVRKLHVAQAYQARGTWGKRGIGDAGILPGRTLGVLGLGAIGGRVAEIGACFGMRVVALRRQTGETPGVAHVYTPDEKLAFLAESDVVVNTLPLTPETVGFLDAEAIAAMTPGAILINIGRGKTVDTDALLAALHDGRLGGAGLDVTDPEPLPDGHPLWTAPNTIITPHYAGAHPEYNHNTEAVFLENLRRYRAGEPLTCLVDRAAGY
jgi:phosphoglycerate dehydrogenase-like enzyme